MAAINTIQSYRWLRFLPGLFIGLVSLAIFMAVYQFSQSHEKVPQLKKVQQHITVIQPPPPVITPPMEQKLPEQKMPEPELTEIEPEPTPEPSPEKDLTEPTKDLGLDADAQAGSDGFGLLANKGGRALLGGSGAGNAILWYGGQIKRQLEDGLQNLLTDTVAMQLGYSIVLEVWVGTDGQINRAALVDGSGIANVDTAIRNALPKLHTSIGKAPPDNMPQPVKVRITARI